jgi:hexosaminidase
LPRPTPDRQLRLSLIFPNRQTRDVFRIRYLAAVALFATFEGCASAYPMTSYPIIPEPRSLTPEKGAFKMGPSTRVVVADSTDPEQRRLADFWAAPVRAATGWGLPIAAGRCEKHAVCFGVGRVGAPEGYHLSVSGDNIVVTGDDHAGLFYGIQSLTQLLPAAWSGSDPVSVPSVDVADAPRFPYRGMHLDVARHFFGPAFVKRYIDLLSRYKINYFHWHLTDDQGWRIEIKRYPKLTEIGSRRAETQVAKNMDPFVGDSTPYGGYYTQDEIRDIVAYAQKRFVTIIPEIEMPGHSLAALAAYPELACTPGPFDVGTHWGVYEDIYCPKEATFTFLENVLTEVMDLFPGKYIHIGGDEAPKTRWEASDTAQAVMTREGLTDEDQLQSYFVGRIEKFLNAHGRSLIGWDEILEGGLAPNATVMSWRGIQGGIDAAQQGHDVIMTPGSPLYFDHYQGPPATEPLAIGGYNPLEKVYAYEPVPDGLTPEQASHILGAQGNLWTEYLSDAKHVEYMVLPRMFALSEVDWTDPTRKSFDDFARRLPWHLERLDAMGVNYRIPDVVGLEHDQITLDKKVKVSLLAPAHGTIRYTLDGSDPGPDSPAYARPLELKVERGPVKVTARMILPDGRQGPVRSATFTRETPEPAALVDVPLEPGLQVELLQGRFRRIADLSRGETVRREPVSDVSLPAWANDTTSFALRFQGYLSVPEDGVYTFRLTADDGAVLRFAGETVLDNDGPHGSVAKEGQVALAKGLHSIQVLYYQAGGGADLKLEMAGPDGAMGAIPAGAILRVR